MHYERFINLIEKDALHKVVNERFLMYIINRYSSFGEIWY
jgi:hypothetical protein